MEGTLLVTPQELKNTASSFGTHSKTIKSITSSMMNTVKRLSQVYEGEAASAYINTFSRLEEDMRQIDNKIQEHVTDLNDMADNYIRTEDAATQGNSALNSDYI